MTNSRARLRVTAWATLGLVILQLGWILSVIPFFGIDEFDHAMRASSVANGHWHATRDVPPPGTARGDLIRVRDDVARAAQPSCEIRAYTRKYNCHPRSNPSGNEVVIASGAARYNPIFYGVVGTAAKPLHGNASLYAMRATSAAICALVFALMVWLLTGLSRTVWLTTVALLTVFPTTVYSTALAAPNGLNMVSGIGVWVAGLAVAEGTLRRAGYVGLALFGSLLVNTHTFGLLWLSLIAVGLALLTGPRRLARTLVPRGRVEITAFAGAAFATIFAVVWVLTSGVNQPNEEGVTFSGTPWEHIARGFILWPSQAIGAFPLREDPAPPAVYALAAVVLAAVSILAIRRIRLRSRQAWTLVFIGVTSFLVPACLTVATFHQIGAAWQGRYQVPFTAGALVIMGLALDRSPRIVRFARLTASALVTAFALAQAIGQDHVAREERTLRSLVSATHWHPPSTTLLVALALLTAGCWVLAVRSASALHPSEHSAPAEV